MKSNGENNATPADVDPESASTSKGLVQRATSALFQIFDEETREYASLTTYHGMIRIYNSNNCPSITFWCCVVLSCLVMFMIHSGKALAIYATKPTFLHTKHVRGAVPKNVLPAFTICKMGNFDPEKLKAWNMTANQLKYMRQVVHNNNFVASFPLFYAAEWADYERQYFEAYGSAFSVYHFVQQTSYDCTDTIREFWLGGEPRENVCKIAKKIVADVGVCWHIATGDVRGPREELDGLLVDVAMDDEYDGIAVEVHSASAPPNILSKALRVPAGQKLYTSLSIIKQQFLDRKNWGHCSDNVDVSDNSSMHVPLDMESCVRRCKRVQFLEQCGCLPYSLYDDVSPECTVQQWYDCAHSNLRSLRKCPCTVECVRVLYKHSFTSYAQLAIEKGNVSSISISWKDSTSLEQTQQKRILTVDLLSWIAGYMGLFLGMSCITLLEIFVYLLKLVCGLNDNKRYKAYDDQDMLGMADAHGSTDRGIHPTPRRRRTTTSLSDKLQHIHLHHNHEEAKRPSVIDERRQSRPGKSGNRPLERSETVTRPRTRTNDSLSQF